MPPQAPSQVLPGLMEGASLRRPQPRPTKYAAVSATQTNTSTASTCSGGSAASASAAGTRMMKPAASNAIRCSGLTPRASHIGATITQKSTAAMSTMRASGSPSANTAPNAAATATP